ncbi:MAG: hypothetical protein PVSMB1_16260 [Gemmatimonadaceae bacterium]
MLRLIGPGGAGKSTTGALLAERLNVPFLDLDRHLAGRVGDITEYINRHGYDAYARENVEAYCSLFRGGIRPDVLVVVGLHDVRKRHSPGIQAHSPRTRRKRLDVRPPALS